MNFNYTITSRAGSYYKQAVLTMSAPVSLCLELDIIVPSEHIPFSGNSEEDTFSLLYVLVKFHWKDDCLQIITGTEFEGHVQTLGIPCTKGTYSKFVKDLQQVYNDRE